MSGPLVARATTSASVEAAWDHYTSAERVTTWRFATEEWHCPAATQDLRVGGAFSYTMAARDGSMSFDYAGTWEVVEPHTRLVHVLGDGRRVETTFTPVEGGTEVVETFDPDPTNPHELQVQGWTLILERFARTA